MEDVRLAFRRLAVALLVVGLVLGGFARAAERWAFWLAVLAVVCLFAAGVYGLMALGRPLTEDELEAQGGPADGFVGSPADYATREPPVHVPHFGRAYRPPATPADFGRPRDGAPRARAGH